MGGNLDHTVAKLRVAVRRALADVVQTASHHSVVVGLSGGADSLALTAATVFEAAKLHLQVYCAVVDHALQPDSAAVAATAAATATRMGAVAQVLPVSVQHTGEGLESAARTQRYQALADFCDAVGSTLLLTGHTEDDQAEQVLLALARGSGVQAIAGIPPRRTLVSSGGNEITVLRPLLRITRVETEAACRAAGLEWWDDPHNREERFLRARVRHRVLPVLREHLGEAVSVNLARTAQLAHADAAALQELTERSFAAAARLRRDSAGQVSAVVFAVPDVQQQPEAIRTRMIRRAAAALGCYYTMQQTAAVAALITAWNGQKPLDLPGSRVSRLRGELIFEKTGTINSQQV